VCNTKAAFFEKDCISQQREMIGERKNPAQKWMVHRALKKRKAKNKINCFKIEGLCKATKTKLAKEKSGLVHSL
jgi:hypothetical protein